MNLPALQVTPDELLFHTQQIAQGRGIPLGEVSFKIDPHVRVVPCPMWRAAALPLSVGISMYCQFTCLLECVRTLIPHTDTSGPTKPTTTTTDLAHRGQHAAHHARVARAQAGPAAGHGHRGDHRGVRLDAGAAVLPSLPPRVID